MLFTSSRGATAATTIRSIASGLEPEAFTLLGVACRSRGASFAFWNWDHKCQDDNVCVEIFQHSHLGLVRPKKMDAGRIHHSSNSKRWPKRVWPLSAPEKWTAILGSSFTTVLHLKIIKEEQMNYSLSYLSDLQKHPVDKMMTSVEWSCNLSGTYTISSFPSCSIGNRISRFNICIIWHFVCFSSFPTRLIVLWFACQLSCLSCMRMYACISTQYCYYSYYY